jgi:hypothetical protein
MFIYELPVTVPAQQHAKIVEPGYDALQLDTVHQKNCERRFIFSNVIEKRILKILRPVRRHGDFPSWFGRAIYWAALPGTLPGRLSSGAATIRGALLETRKIYLRDSGF